MLGYQLLNQPFAFTEVMAEKFGNSPEQVEALRAKLRLLL